MTHSAPFLRPAQLSDASSLAALSIEVWLGTYIREGINGFFADYALAEFTVDRFTTILSDPATQVLVSENTTGIDGFIRLCNGQTSPVDSCSDVEIKTLYVQPRHQGKGLGRQLLQAGLAHCNAAGWQAPWLMVYFENPQAQAFYRRHGFTNVGHTYFQIQDQRYRNEVLQHCGAPDAKDDSAL